MYTLYKGDCLEIMENIPEKSIDMILCDPPYGTTHNKWDSVIDLDRMWKLYDRVTHDNSAIVLFSQSPFDKVLACSNIKNYRYEWIWDKLQPTGFLNCKRMPMKVHETILVFYRKLPTYNPIFTKGKPYSVCSGKISTLCYNKLPGATRTANTGYRYPIDILRFGKVHGTVHPTQKPVDLLEYLIKTYTAGGATVLDNCMGSGSTGVACVNTGRRFVGMEKDERFFGVAKERIEHAEREVSMRAEKNALLSLLCAEQSIL